MYTSMHKLPLGVHEVRSCGQGTPREPRGQTVATSEGPDGRFVFEDTEDCPIRDVVARIGDKWSLIVLLALAEGSERFNALKRRIVGISQRMLTRTLRQLERDGYVLRTVHAEVPVRVEYSLTDLGRSLVEPMWALIGWARTHHDAVRSAREAYDAQAFS